MARSKQSEKRDVSNESEVEYDFDRKYSAKDLESAKKGHYYFNVGMFEKTSGEPVKAYIGGAPGRFKKETDFVFYRPLRLAGSKENVRKFLEKNYNKKDYNLNNDGDMFTAENTKKTEDGEGSQRKVYDEERSTRRKFLASQDKTDEGLLPKVKDWVEQIKKGQVTVVKRPKKAKKVKAESKKESSAGGARRHPLYKRMEKAESDGKVLDVTNYTSETPVAKSTVLPGENSSKVKLSDYPIIVSSANRKNLEEFLTALKEQAKEAVEKDESSEASKFSDIDIPALLREFKDSCDSQTKSKSSVSSSKSTASSSSTKSSASTSSSKASVGSSKSSKQSEEPEVVPVVGRKLGNFRSSNPKLKSVKSPK